jgi:hypothetical protein
MKVANEDNAQALILEVSDMDGKLILIDVQSRGVPITVCLQSLQTEDSSIGAGKLPMIVKLVLVNPDILAMISGGIMRIKGLWVRFLFRFSSNRFVPSLVMSVSRFASSSHRLQGELLGPKMPHSRSCRSMVVESESSAPQSLQLIAADC